VNKLYIRCSSEPYHKNTYIECISED